MPKDARDYTYSYADGPLFVEFRMSSYHPSPLAMSRRPPFPSGWSSIPITTSNLSLSNTLPVGQSFLWHRLLVKDESTPHEWSRVVDRPPRVVCLRQSHTHLFYTAIHPTHQATEQDRRDGLTLRWLEDYFRLHVNLTDLYGDWARRDPELFGKTELDDRVIGVRLLRQDPWECLIA